jgi:phage terminase large subunit
LKDLNINPKFLPFNEVDSRYFIYTGGRGSGKSYAVAGALVYLSLTSNQTILFTRYTLRSAAISIIPEFKDKLETMGIMHLFKITRDEIINISNGSKILFRGIKTSSGDQTANLKSLQGITTWVMDEAEELIDESIFDKIDLSVREKSADNRVILILNPATKEHWIYQRFFESKGIESGQCITKGDITYMHSTYKDNIEHLSNSYISQINEMKIKRPSKYKHQILGGWLEKAEGVIFNNWTLGEFKEIGKSVFGQDYGFSNDPTTLLETSIDKNKRIIYIKLHFCQASLTTTEINVLNQKFAGQNLIIGDSSEPRLINELARNCNMLPAIKGPGSVNFGISLLQDYDLIIDPNSIELIKELNNYSWLEKKSQTPIDKFNHCIDAVRYAVSYQLENPTRGDYFIF